MKGKGLAFVLLVLLALPIVISAPQTPLTESFVGSTGFEIEHSLLVDIEQNADTLFSFHVYNLTKGKQVKKGLSCEFNLFNRSGEQIFTNIVTHETPEDRFEYNISGGNFSDLGFHSYLITCNTSTEGGFFGSELEVTRNGGNEELDNRPLAELIMILGVIIIYFVILARLFTERDFTEHGMIKLLFYLTAFWVILIPIQMGVIYNDEHNGPIGITQLFETMHFIIVTLNSFITVYFVLWFIVQMLKKIGAGHRLKNMRE